MLFDATKLYPTLHNATLLDATPRYTKPRYATPHYAPYSTLRTLFDATHLIRRYAIRRYSTLLDATRLYSTLLDGTRCYCYTTLHEATRRYSTLFDLTRRYSTLLDATRRYAINRGRSIDLFRIVSKWSLDGVPHRGLVLACCLVQSPRSEHLALLICASHLRALIRDVYSL
jgi:hypothetical protein